MKHGHVAVCAVALISACSMANAATFSRSMVGSFTGALTYDPYTYGTIPWEAVLEVETDSAADGVYSGASLLRLDFTTLDPTPFDGIQFDIDGSAYPELEVTIQYGQISQVTSGDAHLFSGAYFNGGSFIYENYGKIMQYGALSLVPEPATAVLLAAGLGFAAWRRRTARVADESERTAAV